jgi:GntR family transcriptional regulator
VETSYLPSELVPGLVAADLIGNQSLYALLRNRYGLTFGKSDFHVSVAPSPEAEANLLELPPDAAALLMRSVVYDVNDKPVESLISWNHPDRVAFESLQADGNALESVYTDWTRVGD